MESKVFFWWTGYNSNHQTYHGITISLDPYTGQTVVVEISRIWKKIGLDFIGLSLYVPLCGWCVQLIKTRMTCLSDILDSLLYLDTIHWFTMIDCNNLREWERKWEWESHQWSSTIHILTLLISFSCWFDKLQLEMWHWCDSFTAILWFMLQTLSV